MYDSHNHYRYCEVEFPYTNFLNLRLISLTVVFICLLSFISYPKHGYQFFSLCKNSLMAKTFKLKLSYFTLTVHVHRANKYSYKETPSSLHTYIAKNKTKEHKKCFTISTVK